LAFYPAERYISPAMGRNWGEKGSDTFLPGRNGRKLGDVLILMLSTITICKQSTFAFCTGIQLIINLFICLPK